MKQALIAVLLLLWPFILYAQSDNLSDDFAAEIDSLKRWIEKLSQEVEKLKSQQREEGLEDLRESALRELQTEDEKKQPGTKTFQSGSQSLNVFNPEISVTGDLFGLYKIEVPHYTEHLRSGFKFRVLEVNIQSNLDPFSFAKALFEFGEEGLELSEAYITWVNPLPRLKITAGKFRQQFGVINRWHEHALDQTFYPLPIELYMGEEGLSQLGVSLEWLMPPLMAHANELIVQITNSENENLFSGEEFGLPATLIRFKNFYDLTRNTYFEFGLTGLAGTNDRLGFTLNKSHTWTYLAGADFTLSWSPAGASKYKGVTWRNELFYLRKEILHSQPVTAWGGFSYLDYRLTARFIAGVRFDVAQPPELENSGKFLWQVVPYLTFWQSEFVYLRLQWNHLQGRNIAEKDNRIMLQVDWSVGPHKHEKY